MAAALLLPQLSFGQELKVMSYNIRLGSGEDGTNSWQFRAPLTLEMLEDQAPDVFGVQEALRYQVDFIKEFTDDYECVGVGRDNGKKEGEHMSIFWNKNTVKMLKWGTFWLSETPEKPSMGWDAACYRTATWALMKDKRTGKKFYFVNTHLDHVGKQARANGLALIVDRIAEINPEGYPMVLTGDFNVKPDDPCLTGLDARMKSTRKIAAKTDNHHTYNGWGKASKDSVIDYIYISGFSACPEYQTVTKRYSDRTYISDHYPITARLIF
jgi:endonuclease/exonuclease/phosphatase family metal-dependent hydrolase